MKMGECGEAGKHIVSFLANALMGRLITNLWNFLLDTSLMLVLLLVRCVEIKRHL
jgi:hypothetical protein